MDIKDGFATSSKEHLWILVRVHEPDEITSNGGEDRSVTKEHPRGLKRKRPNFITENLHLGHEDDIIIIMQVEGASRGGPGPVGPGWPARPTPDVGSAPLPCTRRIFNPKALEAPPFARERAIW
jgi:hypothetical protein